MNPTTSPHTPPSQWSRFAAACVAAYHRYGNWLVSITWWRFFGLSFALVIAMAIIHDLPPLSWTYVEVIKPHDPAHSKSPTRAPSESSKSKPYAGGKEGVDISIDERGVVIKARPAAPAAPASPAHPAVPALPASGMVVPELPPIPEVNIKLPPGANSDVVREAVEDAKREIESAIADAQREAQEAIEEAADASRPRIRHRSYGEALMPLTMWFILLSGILKITYKGKVQAEAKAAQATEVAESESLKRQVVEARMAAMQAQVEPHFLFNTLASIDHLIETDPPRASIMQKNLIALLRASMPSMREANAQGSTRDLGKELAVIRPFLEILKVRMEERLQTEVRVSDGLLSAEFPPMMLQSLVENAIKHGLEPKAEGGQLTVSAEIVHGKLAVTVADTGLGFGKAATAGTGIGLSNIRERLALLYGGKASLNITETPGGGTSVTITVPYVACTDSERSGQA
ncbi:sensor histidine kinase [Rhodoferax sp. AJA081-3]|uniref:sensor histidine kinase n=1 Tax=Rhodoferax sp. AJA081-3 TaxID=2752316 RepID=UPI001ADF1E7F|nr:sensor histidine kinase [Rhodoferax sp. AJA081-3]QTN26371.1 sensor histidine kinase [Rhodoferax sp. AJA081-3]